MALGATFWATLGASALWYDLSTFTDGTLIGVGGTGMLGISIGPCEIYQEPTISGGTQSRNQNNPGYDSGFFYGRELVSSGGAEVVDGKKLWADAVFLVGRPFPYVSPGNGQWVFLQPHFEKGDLVPVTVAVVGNPSFQKSPTYKTGFLNKYDAAVPAEVYPVPTNMDMAATLWVENVVGDWRLWHYNPYAWSGTPPEVVASAAMHAGVSADYIDQAAFDNAHDAYDLSTGDAPWSDLDQQWTIHAPRIVGDNVAAFLVHCANHSRDLIFVNESGKLSISSWTRPGFSVEGIRLGPDQLIDIISWADTLRHTFNTVRCGWGSAGRQAWEDTDGYVGDRPGAEESSVVFEPNLESRPGSKWIHEAEDTTSSSWFGQLWLKGRKVLANFRGHPQEVETSSYPYLLTPHVNLANLYKWDEATDGGGMIHVTNWLASDAKPRAEIKIRQGPIGFDMGIGDLVTDLEITGDGRTIAEARVIERTYNFDTLTIDSLIMEIPPNT